jgi:ABC-type transporter Mla MlaB component
MSEQDCVTKTFALPAAILVGDAAELAARLQRALSANALELDGSAVEQIDTAGLQLLLSAVRTAAERGAVLGWAEASAALRASARQIGVSAQLGLEG